MVAFFVPNPAGLLLVQVSTGMQSAMKERADQIAEMARSIAPYDPTNDRNYRDEIEVVAGIEDGRACGRVNAWVPWAGYVEFGTVDTPTHAPLRRASEGGF